MVLEASAGRDCGGFRQGSPRPQAAGAPCYSCRLGRKLYHPSCRVGPLVAIPSQSLVGTWCEPGRLVATLLPLPFLAHLLYFLAACGWIVGRSHREHRGAMVLVYLLTVQLWLLPELLRLTVDVLGNQRFLPYFLTCFAEFILATVGILLGGLWDAAREQATPSNKSLFFRRVKKPV
jgi:4-amino-4-deoxy-L-arabinose transferase-like glycosyltransferase